MGQEGVPAWSQKPEDSYFCSSRTSAVHPMPWWQTAVWFVQCIQCVWTPCCYCASTDQLVSSPATDWPILDPSDMTVILVPAFACPSLSCPVDPAALSHSRTAFLRTFSYTRRCNHMRIACYRLEMLAVRAISVLTEMLVSLPEVEARRAMREQIKSEGHWQSVSRRQKLK